VSAAKPAVGGPAKIPRLAAALAAALGIAAAARSAWLCDDAFISFRYADNLVHGLGLVYNAGERVEGYSNFLWTLWVALGMRFGVRPELWSIAWGIVFYAATIVLLYFYHHRLRVSGQAPGHALPAACLLAAVHRDWNLYATSGLETSMFTFLAMLGYLLAVSRRLGLRGAAGAGLALALAAMTRPDGLLFVPIVGLYLVCTRRPMLGPALAFAGVFAIAWLPYLGWKLSYYGDFLTNTFYASRRTSPGSTRAGSTSCSTSRNTGSWPRPCRSP